MKPTKRIIFIFLGVFLLSALAVGLALGSSERNFRAHLSGSDTGTGSQGQGQAIFQFSQDGEELQYKLIVANIKDVTMAHIHEAPAPGDNGPPVLWLYPDGPPPQPIVGRIDGVLAERTVTAADLVGPMAGGSLDDLKMAIQEGRAYVNVHTLAFPGGEIRGQIK